MTKRSQATRHNSDDSEAGRKPRAKSYAKLLLAQQNANNPEMAQARILNEERTAAMLEASRGRGEANRHLEAETPGTEAEAGTGDRTSADTSTAIRRTYSDRRTDLFTHTEFQRVLSGVVELNSDQIGALQSEGLETPVCLYQTTQLHPVFG